MKYVLLSELSMTGSEIVIKEKHKTKYNLTYLWLTRRYPGYRFHIYIQNNSLLFT